MATSIHAGGVDGCDRARCGADVIPAAGGGAGAAAGGGVACQSNLRQIGQQLLLYAQQSNGWIIPPRRGYEVPPEERWPMVVFKPASITPPVMLCPGDSEPAAGISYVLNWHLVGREIKYGGRLGGGLSPADVVVAGEKVSGRDDYYLNANDFAEGLLATRRHGRVKGMNLLYLDLHVGVDLPTHRFEGQIDPWDVPPPR